MEFKVVEQAGEGKALQQIIDKDYASKYVGQDEIWLIGVEFSSENRNIIGFEYQQG
ncbi:MAG: PD-(D/E)XK nuclease domain-containing protein [Mariprofundales bacterium]